jgi:5-methylcytosine-specific restriction protein B
MVFMFLMKTGKKQRKLSNYESFVGGLAPVHTEESLGLQFKPKPGFLMEAAAAAAKNLDKPYLILID